MENKFNKDFEDFAWSEMQKLLDQDLPVAEKKRRRGLVFWLFAMVGLIAFIGGGAFIYNELNKTELKINNSELNKKQLANTHSELNKKQLANTHSELNNKQLVINNAELNKKQLANTHSELNNKQLVINKAELNENQLTNTHSELNTPFNQAIITEGAPQYLGEKDVIYKIDSNSQGKFIPQEIIAKLNINKLNELIIDTPNLAYSSFIIHHSSLFNSKWHFGVETGIHTEGYEKVDGWQLGVVLSKQFRRNWSVSAGLNFRKTVIHGDSLTYYQARELSGYNNQVSTTNTLIPANRLIINRLIYVELPISLNYSINKKWLIVAGIKTAYLAKANVNVLSDSTLFVLSTKTNSGLINAADRANSSDIKLLGLNRWDFAAIGGIYFKPTDKIQLSLRYDYGFRNSLNRPNWSAYNRFVGVNVAYYFR